MTRFVLVLSLAISGCSGARTPPAEECPQPEPRQPEAPEAREPHESQEAQGHESHGHGHGHDPFEDAEACAKRFDSPERDEWQRPDVVIRALKLESGSRVAEIGSATGYFAVRVARQVTEGRVWGVDIEPDMVRYLNDRARREGLDNLFSILGTADDPLLPEPVDVVLIVNTYHHIEHRTEYLRRLKTRLREGGRVVVVDYKMGDFGSGPPESMRLLPEVVQREFTEAGYQLQHQDTDSLPRQYILVFGS